MALTLSFFPARAFACLALGSSWLLAAIQVHAQSARPGWGAVPYRTATATGVTFRVWAPNASSVTVPGVFNGWSATANPLASEGASGVWSADVAAARPGQEYKYFLKSGLWKRDPRNRLLTGGYENSVVYDPGAFDWSGDAFVAPPLEDLAIYELHIGSFHDSTSGNGLPGQFSDTILKLDYLKGLGFNAIEVLPIAEFPGADSWGYNLSDPFAVESGYGGPDGFKALVKACHQRGLAVLLDVVHNHYGPNDLDLWNFDGWSGGGSGGGIYFYQDAGACCTPYGSRPNYSRTQVRDYIRDSFVMWLDEYHVDGFRWDTPGLMFNSSGGTLDDAKTLITSITGLIRSNYPGKINIAEDVSGMGFDSTWALEFPGTITSQLSQTADEYRDMNTIAAEVAGAGAGLARVLFLESHDVVGDLNSGTRLPAAIDPTTPDSYWARKRSTLGAALVFTSPGVPMIFQGQEMLENKPFSSSRTVDWAKTVTYTNIVRAYCDLVRLRRNVDGVCPGLKGEQCFVTAVDNVNKLLAYRRWVSGADTQDVMVVANFANAKQTGYGLTFPRAGTWYAHFNSDATAYGSDYGNVGSSVVEAAGNPPVGAITIAPYSVLVLSQIPSVPPLTIGQSNGVVTIAWNTAPTGWVLYSTDTSAANPLPWNVVPPAQYVTNLGTIRVSLKPQAEAAFYRLRKVN